MERGFRSAWEVYLSGDPPRHVVVEDIGPIEDGAVEESRPKRNKKKYRRGSKVGKRKSKKTKGLKRSPGRRKKSGVVRKQSAGTTGRKKSEF